MEIIQTSKQIICDLNSLHILSESIKSQRKKIGYISGCFDIIHIGHINLFRYAKKNVDYLFVGIDNDEYIKKAKGTNRPFFDASVRLAQISELRSVDYVFLLNGNYTPNSNECDLMHKSVINMIKPDIIFEGHIGDFTNRKKKLAEELDIEFYNSPYDIIYPTSTSILADVFFFK